MRVNLLFPGQGAQYTGMGLDFYKKHGIYNDIIIKTSEALDEDLLLILQNEDQLKETKNSQLAIFSMGYGISQLLKEAGIKMNAALGLSLGEYGALTYGESMTFSQALSLLKKRSQYMQEAALAQKTFMLAVSFLDTAKVLEVLEGEEDIFLANENAPNQNVVGGPAHKEEEIKGKMLAKGAKKVTSLNVSGAFHTPFMEKATMKFKAELANHEIRFPKIPVLSNFKGDFYLEDDDLKDILAHHMSSPVKLGEALQKLEATEEDYHLIIGPGKAMASMLKQNKIPGQVLKIGTVEEFEQAINVLKEKINE